MLHASNFSLKVSGVCRYGFNGKESDSEWGTGLIQDYGFRLYNPAIGKFLSVDPLTKDYPWNSTYAFAENDVISSIDLEGAEKYRVTMRAWIPWSKVVLPVPNPLGVLAVHGEARPSVYDLKAAGFDGRPGNEGYRIQYQFTIDTDALPGTQALDKASIKSDAGLSILYLYDAPIEAKKSVEGKDYTGQVLGSNVIQEGNDTYFHIYFQIDAKVPLTLLKAFPAIDIQGMMNIRKDWTTGEITQKSTIALDGFPAFEVYFENMETGNYVKTAEFIPDNPRDGFNLNPIIGDEVKTFKDYVLPDGKKYESKPVDP